MTNGGGINNLMSNIWKIYMLAVISFLVGTSQFVIVGVLDKVAASVGVSVATAGQLITVFALANAVGTPLVIGATTKMNQSRQMLLALFVVLIGVVEMFVMPGFNGLLLSRAILGVGTGVFIVSAYAVTAKLASPGQQGKAMSNISMGFSASLVFGVPIGRIITTMYDWQAIFWGIGVLSLTGCFAVRRFLPAVEGNAPVPFSRQLSLLKRPNIAATLAVTFFVFIGYSVINTYITPFLTSVKTMNEQEISSILFALGIASLIGSKLGGVLADRIGITRTLIGSMIVQTLLLTAVTIGFQSATMTIVLILIWATAAWVFGLTQSFNIVSLAPEASSVMLSLNSSFVQLGFAAGAVIGGLAVSASSVATVSAVGALATGVAVCVAIFSLGCLRLRCQACGE